MDGLYFLILTLLDYYSPLFSLLVLLFFRKDRLKDHTRYTFLGKYSIHNIWTSNKKGGGN